MPTLEAISCKMQAGSKTQVQKTGDNRLIIEFKPVIHAWSLPVQTFGNPIERIPPVECRTVWETVGAGNIVVRHLTHSIIHFIFDTEIALADLQSGLTSEGGFKTCGIPSVLVYSLDVMESQRSAVQTREEPVEAEGQEGADGDIIDDSGIFERIGIVVKAGDPPCR